MEPYIKHVQSTKSVGGSNIISYVSSFCTCGWESAPYPSRFVESPGLAERDSNNHAYAHANGYYFNGSEWITEIPKPNCCTSHNRGWLRSDEFVCP